MLDEKFFHSICLLFLGKRNIHKWHLVGFQKYSPLSQNALFAKPDPVLRLKETQHPALTAHLETSDLANFMSGYLSVQIILGLLKTRMPQHYY